MILLNTICYRMTLVYRKYRKPRKSVPVPIIAHSGELILTVDDTVNVRDHIVKNNPILWNSHLGKRIIKLINSSPG